MREPKFAPNLLRIWVRKIFACWYGGKTFAQYKYSKKFELIKGQKNRNQKSRDLFWARIKFCPRLEKVRHNTNKNYLK